MYRQPSKYLNRKTVIDGVEFDSKHEAMRWCELKYMERAGLIYDLQRQVPFVLIPTQRDEVTGKLLEKETKYYADFTYRDRQTNRLVVEDAKGVKTEAYRLKKKLMLYRHGIQIKEV